MSSTSFIGTWSIGKGEGHFPMLPFLKKQTYVKADGDARLSALID